MLPKGNRLLRQWKHSSSPLGFKSQCGYYVIKRSENDPKEYTKKSPNGDQFIALWPPDHSWFPKIGCVQGGVVLGWYWELLLELINKLMQFHWQHMWRTIHFKCYVLCAYFEHRRYIENLNSGAATLFWECFPEIIRWKTDINICIKSLSFFW